MDDRWADEIGKRIRDARKKAKLSQVELGEAIGRTGGMVGHYEQGKRAPFKELRQVAEATNTDIRWLLFGEAYQDPLNRIEARLASIERAMTKLADGRPIADSIRKTPTKSGAGPDAAQSEPGA